MIGTYSTKTQDLLERLNAFFDQHIYPNEARHHAELHAARLAGDAWQPLALIDELKVKARAVGL